VPDHHGGQQQLHPVDDKPMIYYPLSTLMLTGVRDIVLISTPPDLPDLPRHRQLRGDALYSGLRLTCAEQPVSNRLAGQSSLAVTGPNLDGKRMVATATARRLSCRGECEIVDLVVADLSHAKFRVGLSGRGLVRLDAGTCDALHEAPGVVRPMEKRQGFKVAAPEEIAWRKQSRDEAQLRALATPAAKSADGKSLLRPVRDGNAELPR
jgi:glucose-1-phosphate thymidylyltransferase